MKYARCEGIPGKYPSSVMTTLMQKSIPNPKRAATAAKMVFANGRCEMAGELYVPTGGSRVPAMKRNTANPTVGINEIQPMHAVAEP